MKSDNGLYKLIYEYFETRLLYGYYACGDSLPSIARIGDMFRMAPGPCGPRWRSWKKRDISGLMRERPPG